MDEAPNPTRRLAGLDVLRCVAVLLVLGRHIDRPAGELPWIIARWQQGGWVGVDLFFVLSGFLVSGLLFTEYQKTGRFSPARFYIRRGWKIYPPFAVLILTTIAVRSIRQEPAGAHLVIPEVLFFQNYAMGLWNHTWSLAVEEHFYLLLPALLGLTLLVHPRRPFATVPWLACAIGLTCLWLRVDNWQARASYSHFTHLFPTHLRFDSLLFGVALSYVYHFHRGRLVQVAYPWRHALCALGVSAFLPAFVWPLESSAFLPTAGLTLLSLGGTCLVLGVLLCTPSNHVAVRFTAALGASSYSVYLWHMPVVSWLMPAFGAIGLVGYLLVYVGSTFAIGHLMAHLVEWPALRVRDRLFPAVRKYRLAPSPAEI